MAFWDEKACMMVWLNLAGLYSLPISPFCNTHTHTHAHTHTHTHTLTHTDRQTHKHTEKHKHTLTHFHTYTQTLTYTFSHTPLSQHGSFCSNYHLFILYNPLILMTMNFNYTDAVQYYNWCTALQLNRYFALHVTHLANTGLLFVDK